MYQNIKRNIYKNKHVFVFGFIIIFALLLAVAYQSDYKITAKNTNSADLSINSDLELFKKYLVKKN